MLQDFNQTQMKKLSLAEADELRQYAELLEKRIEELEKFKTRVLEAITEMSEQYYKIWPEKKQS